MSKKLILTILMIGLVVLAAAACGDKEYEAEAIHEDVDKCDICNMQVVDDGFATQLITEEGKVYKFDDIGCMNEWMKKNSGEEVAIQFVRDHNTEEWIKMDNAYYAYDPSFKTPMAYGLVSFKEKEEAQKFINEQGKGVLLESSDLAAHTWERNMGNMKMDMEMKDNHEQNAHMETDTKGKNS